MTRLSSLLWLAATLLSLLIAAWTVYAAGEWATCVNSAEHRDIGFSGNHQAIRSHCFDVSFFPFSLLLR